MLSWLYGEITDKGETFICTGFAIRLNPTATQDFTIGCSEQGQSVMWPSLTPYSQDIILQQRCGLKARDFD